MVNEITGNEISPNKEPNKFGIRSYALSTSKHRLEKNEDALVSLPEKGVYAVLDGMGGGIQADVCSRTGAASLESSLSNIKETDPEKLGEIVYRSLKTASADVEETEPLGRGGTTAAVFFTTEHEGKRYGIIGNVGDSSVIRVRNGQIETLVDEDNGGINAVVTQKGLKGEAALAEKRRIAKKLNKITTREDFDALNDDEREAYDHRNVLSQALGARLGDNVIPHIAKTELLPGDIILLLTDGIRDCLSDSEILGMVRNKNIIEQMPSLLTREAEYRSNHKNQFVRWKPQDDKTVIVLSVEDSSQQGKTEATAREPKQAEPTKQYRAETPVDLNAIINLGAVRDELQAVQREQQTPKLKEAEDIARDAWAAKGNLVHATGYITRTFDDVAGMETSRNGRIKFPQKSEAQRQELSNLAYDPKRLMEGILAGDYAGKDMLLAYYPHIDGDLITRKTTFGMSADQAVGILEKCAQELHWPKDYLQIAVDIYKQKGETGFQDPLHRSDSIYAIEDALIRKKQQENPKVEMLKAEPDAEKAKAAEQFITQGLDLIKDHKYDDAVKYFQNPNVAKELGILYSTMTYWYPKRIETLSDDAIDQAFDRIATHFHFNTPRGSKPDLRMADVDSGTDPRDGLPQPINFPQRFLEQYALSYAEEWLHALQYLRHEPIAGIEYDEADVAAYMIQHGITLPENYLAKYDRREILREEGIIK